MEDAACPRCRLPRDADAWHCDGCGHIFDGDLRGLHGRLRAKYARSSIGHAAYRRKVMAEQVATLERRLERGG